MNCCIECFLDNYLKDFIRVESQTRGDCDFCGSTNVRIIAPSELEGFFEPVVGLYSPLEVGRNILKDENPADVGENLGQLIDNDWEVFSDTLGSHERTSLLDAIMNPYPDLGGERVPVDELWTDRKDFYDRTIEDMWDALANHIKNERRYILDSSKREIKQIISLLPEVIPTVGSNLNRDMILYRARLGSKPPSLPYDLNDMKSPPPEKAGAGRANPAGISFLYLSDSIETAIAEVRPWKGAKVTVAEFSLLQDIEIADLTKKISLSTPFGLSDLAARIDDYQLLRYLGKILSTPVDPKRSDVEYAPSQYLTELIRHLGYKGIVYPSAMASGKNIVLFEEQWTNPYQARLYEIEDITYESKTL